jgi:hypothetical protein
VSSCHDSVASMFRPGDHQAAGGGGFIYLDQNGKRVGDPDVLGRIRGRLWVDVRSADINAFIRELSGAEFTAKDFRTWNATVLAAVALSVSEHATSAAGRTRAVSRAMQEVAHYLMSSEPGEDDVTDGGTIADAMQWLETEGYTGQSAARAGAMLLCFTCRRESPAAEVKLHRLLRTEGASDAADETAIVALTCPSCGARGTVVLTYGPEASADDAEVLRLLEDTRS